MYKYCCTIKYILFDLSQTIKIHENKKYNSYINIKLNNDVEIYLHKKIRFLAQGHLSRGTEGGESAVHSLPPPTIPAGPETRTRNLSISTR